MVETPRLQMQQRTRGIKLEREFTNTWPPSKLDPIDAYQLKVKVAARDWESSLNEGDRLVKTKEMTPKRELKICWNIHVSFAK